MPSRTDEKIEDAKGTGADAASAESGQSGAESGNGAASGDGTAIGRETGQEVNAAGAPVKRERAKRPDTSGIKSDAIRGAVLAQGGLIAASVPVQERSDEQREMDGVAASAYKEWIKRGRPNPKTEWAKCPVVMYFLEPGDEVTAYRYLIRMACNFVKPEADAPGVRVFWGNEFTLSEKMAKEIGRPDDAGKTVLGWLPVNKQVRETKSDTSAQTNATTNAKK